MGGGLPAVGVGGRRAAPASRSPVGVRHPPGGLSQLSFSAWPPHPPPPHNPRTPGPALPSLPTRNRKWPVGGSRAMASSGRQLAELVRPVAAGALHLADSRRPARPPRENRAGGERRRAASRGFRDNNKKMATSRSPPAPSERPAADRAAGAAPLTGWRVCGYILLRSRIIHAALVGCARQRRAAHPLRGPRGGVPGLRVSRDAGGRQARRLSAGGRLRIPRGRH